MPTLFTSWWQPDIRACKYPPHGNWDTNTNTDTLCQDHPVLSLSVQRDRSKSIKKQTTDQSAVSALCRWRGVGPWRWSKPDTDGSLISPKLNKTSHWVWNGFQRLGSYMIEAQRCFICASSPAHFWGGGGWSAASQNTHTNTHETQTQSPFVVFGSPYKDANELLLFIFVCHYNLCP